MSTPNATVSTGSILKKEASANSASASTDTFCLASTMKAEPILELNFKATAKFPTSSLEKNL